MKSLKAECVGHVQKCVGTRLREFKTECKELMSESFYADKKNTKQKKLTFYITRKMFNRLQNYYGIAIRACVHVGLCACVYTHGA